MRADSLRDVFDRAAATYDVAGFPFFTPFGEALAEFARIGPGERVLDAGCGSGAALAPAARRGRSAVGVELSPAMAERAREAAPGAEVVVGDAAKLDFADGSFDVVLAAFVVFFMPDPTAALREWTRVLAADGRVVLSTWASPDPRWTAWERELRGSFIPAMDQELVKEIGADLARLDRFSSAAKVAEELALAGLEAERQLEHRIEFVFADEQAWWDWNWSHGSRVFLEALPEDARERFRAQCREAMQAVRTERGYPRTYSAIFTSATR
jgi:ubiquinone/menaquinone biosynthesis C-methylase UbiE